MRRGRQATPLTLRVLQLLANFEFELIVLTFLFLLYIYFSGLDFERIKVIGALRFSLHPIEDFVSHFLQHRYIFRYKSQHAPSSMQRAYDNIL